MSRDYSKFKDFDEAKKELKVISRLACEAAYRDNRQKELEDVMINCIFRLQDDKADKVTHTEEYVELKAEELEQDEGENLEYTNEYQHYLSDYTDEEIERDIPMTAGEFFAEKLNDDYVTIYCQNRKKYFTKLKELNEQTTKDIIRTYNEFIKPEEVMKLLKKGA